MFLNNLPLDLLFKAAKSAREYKRAVIYYEEHIRNTVLNKSSATLADSKEHQKPLYIVDQTLEYDELKELVECYAKILPEDYDLKAFSSLNSRDRSSEGSQSVFNSTPRKRIEEGFGLSQDETILFVNPFESEPESEDYNQKLYSLLEKKSHTKLQKLLNNIFTNFKEKESNLYTDFEGLKEYFEDIDLCKIEVQSIEIDFLDKDSYQVFENVSAFLLYLLYEIMYPNGIQQSEMEAEQEKLNITVKFFKIFCDRIQFIIVQFFIGSHGEKANMLKLYLHCIFEVKHVYEKFFEWVIKPKGDSQSGILSFIDIQSIMSLFDKRIDNLNASQINLQTLNLIYSTRIYLFALLNRPYE